jgi:hypothetical protein
MQSRADLHVHSKYSDRPSEWILRRIGAPESFMEPMEVYRRAKGRGMDFVTLSDHNKINGALEIAHLPDTFISCEVTTYFPEDGAKLHFLVCGIDESQFRMINELRTNIYELRRYVVEQDIVHSVAHPLFRANDKLGADHIEKLLVLFNRFEGINGTRDPRAADLVNVIFRNLTPEVIERLADKHDLQPHGDQPWRKTFTGGSDDHGGVYIASAYTMTPYARTVDDYLAHLRAGNHEMGGASGNSLMLAHSFYHIAYSYYRARVMGGSQAKTDLVGELLKRLMEKPANGQTTATYGQRLRNVASRFVWARRRSQMNDTERMLVDQFSRLFEEVAIDPAVGEYDAAFHSSCRICHHLSWSFLADFFRHARAGNLVESLQTIASLGPVALSFAPYLAAFSTQHKDEQFLREVAARFDASHHMVQRSQREVWLVDSLRPDGPIDRMVHAAVAEGRDVSVVTCQYDAIQSDLDITNFAPVGKFTMTQRAQRPLCFPPFLEIIAHIEQQRFAEVVIATPGPMGLVGLVTGRLLGLNMTSIYHPHFAVDIGLDSEEGQLDEELGVGYLNWLCDQTHRIIATHADHRRALLDAGVEIDKVQLVEATAETVDRRQSSMESAAIA